MDNNIYEIIEKYAGELAAMESYDCNTWKILVKLGGNCYETIDGADFAALTQDDIGTACGEDSVHPIERQILQADNGINALVLSRTPYCLQAAKQGRPLAAALDDMAQIVGYQVQTVSYEKEAVDTALKKATGCFIKEKDHAKKGFTITTGRNLYEAVVALTVLEKSAEVNLKAEALGGAKPLPKIEADLMRMIYKKKYSVAEQEVKSKEGDA
ncbi:hypothetical protein [Emergencia sp.]|uniref:hypothetical protein n=1 Tax=Emergencia sp. TaxID=1926557 RepID=UPI003AEF9CF4